jgi:type IV secretion system protein VirB1
VRKASSFEPLLITVQARKPVPIQASDRDEAIQFATEAIATGQPVRTGLAQLDAADMKEAGLTATTTFDACKHIAGLGRLFQARLQAANVNASGHDQAIARVVASFATNTSRTTPEPRTPPGDADISTGETPNLNAPAPAIRERPNWDVYRSGLGTSAFVYGRL